MLNFSNLTDLTDYILEGFDVTGFRIKVRRAFGGRFIDYY